VQIFSHFKYLIYLQCSLRHLKHASLEIAVKFNDHRQTTLFHCPFRVTRIFTLSALNQDDTVTLSLESSEQVQLNLIEINMAREIE